MHLWAISDLHLNYPSNMRALEETAYYPNDDLILGGDIADDEVHFRKGLELLAPRFKRIAWVPGNHELWTPPHGDARHRGVEKYLSMVSVAREFGVVTPEDPYEEWVIGGAAYLIVPMFLLYDYSFRPKEVEVQNAVEWAASEGIVCTDEFLIHPEPYACIADWCRQRCIDTHARLTNTSSGLPKILINHFPLRFDHVYIPKIPRFSIWCGTEITEDWHRISNVEAVVYGHLHVRTTRWQDGVRFEEVSLGYPKQWSGRKGIDGYLRRILPAPADVDRSGVLWHP